MGRASHPHYQPEEALPISASSLPVADGSQARALPAPWACVLPGALAAPAAASCNSPTRALNRLRVPQAFSLKTMGMVDYGAPRQVATEEIAGLVDEYR